VTLTQFCYLMPLMQAQDEEAEAEMCLICLETRPPPIRLGCACRGSSGMAHVGCMIENAVRQRPTRGAIVWSRCQTCHQRYTKEMLTALAHEWYSQVREQQSDSEEKLLATCHLQECLRVDGRSGESSVRLCELLDVANLGPRMSGSLASKGSESERAVSLEPRTLNKRESY